MVDFTVGAVKLTFVLRPARIQGVVRKDFRPSRWDSAFTSPWSVSYERHCKAFRGEGSHSSQSHQSRRNDWLRSRDAPIASFRHSLS